MKRRRSVNQSLRLLKCPFCGYKYIDSGCMSDCHNWYVICGKCKTSSGYYGTEQEAVDFWNKRATND